MRHLPTEPQLDKTPASCPLISLQVPEKPGDLPASGHGVEPSSHPCPGHSRPLTLRCHQHHSLVQGLRAPPQSRPLPSGRHTSCPAPCGRPVKVVLSERVSPTFQPALRPACRRSPRSAAGPGRRRPSGPPAQVDSSPMAVLHLQGASQGLGLSEDPQEEQEERGSQGPRTPPQWTRLPAVEGPRRASPRGPCSPPLTRTALRNDTEGTRLQGGLSSAPVAVGYRGGASPAWALHVDHEAQLT